MGGNQGGASDMLKDWLLILVMSCVFMAEVGLIVELRRVRREFGAYRNDIRTVVVAAGLWGLLSRYLDSRKEKR